MKRINNDHAGFETDRSTARTNERRMATMKYDELRYKAICENNASRKGGIL